MAIDTGRRRGTPPGQATGCRNSDQIPVTRTTSSKVVITSASFRSAEAFVFITAAYLAGSLSLTALGAWVQRRWPVRTL